MASHSDEVNTVPKQSRNKPDAQQRAEKLFKFLRSRREDRGVMADLRCALVDGKRHRASVSYTHLDVYKRQISSPCL